MPSVLTYHGSRNLMSPNDESVYAGLITVRPPGWSLIFVCPAPGDSFVAAGGEFALGYEPRPGLMADGFTLRAGERATVVGWDEDTFFAEWRIETA